MHVLFTFTEDRKGAVHTKFHFQPQGLKGYGNDTGDRYNATGVTQGNESTAATGYPYTWTWVNNFRMIGQGPGNNFAIHQNSHITVNANGEITAQVDNHRVTCK